MWCDVVCVDGLARCINNVNYYCSPISVYQMEMCSNSSICKEDMCAAAVTKLDSPTSDVSCLYCFNDRTSMMFMDIPYAGSN